MFDNLRAQPDRAVSRARYSKLAPKYDATCKYLGGIRQAALAALGLRPGETVMDVACGTGAMLPALVQAVGPGGRVIGIEHSPEMLAVARRRIRAGRLGANVTLIESPAEEAHLDRPADAILFSYTHDVLQSPRALERIFNAAKPAARIVVVGARLLPWWAVPINLWTCYRARKYLTSYSGLREPWRRVSAYCPDLRIVRTFHLGTGYLARATFQT